MTAPAVEGLDLAVLDRFFIQQVPDYDGGLRAELLSGGRSNLTYRLTDGVSTWVLRRPPLGTLTPSAHDMAREYRVIAALHGSGTPVPAPVVLADASVLGAPFTVVGYVPGAVVRSEEDLAPLSDDQVHRCAAGLVDALAELHSVDPAAVGLTDFGRPEGLPAPTDPPLIRPVGAGPHPRAAGRRDPARPPRRRLPTRERRRDRAR